MYVKHERHPELPPPPSELGALGWLRHNLFSSWGNALLTVASVALLCWTIPPVLRWAVLDATWLGDTRDACLDSAGACWVFIKVRLGMLAYGFYPQAERWRIDLFFLLLVAGGGPLVLGSLLPRRGPARTLATRGLAAAGAGLALVLHGLLPGLLAAAYLGLPSLLARLRAPAAPGAAAKLGLALLAGVPAHALAPQGVALAAGWTALTLTALVLLVPRADEQGWRLALLLTALPALGAVLFLGDGTWLPEVETDRWGGMFLSLVIALVGIATSLPVGILLALGRRSSLPVIRTLSICYIELIRGVPLISVLFMASVMLPLTLPDGMHVDKLLRALVGVSLFYAAYMAEVVRGGLQGIGRGQYEAAQSLGLSYPKAMILVIMPQALRLVIPGITNTFLGLMKDTTLVAVINLMDLLGVIKSALADSQWLGFTKEAYLFAALAFWVLCFGLSRFALHLERRLRYEKH